MPDKPALSRVIVFRRVDDLIRATTDGIRIAGEQRLASVRKLLGGSGADEEPCVWTVSPNGRQIAFLDSDGSMVRVAVPGGREAGALFSLTRLRGPNGRPVTLLPPFARLPHQPKDYPLPEREIEGAWRIVSLRWGSDGKRLYVSLAYGNTLGGFATCAVNAATGRALIDRDGNWRCFLPTGSVDEGYGWLAGCGLGRTTDESQVANSRSRYAAPYVSSEADGGGAPLCLLPARFNSGHMPPYAFGTRCAVGPGGAVAVGGNGLWLTSARSGRFVCLATFQGKVGGLVWVGSRALIYHREPFIGQPHGSLWAVLLTPDRRAVSSPHLLLEGISGLQGMR